MDLNFFINKQSYSLSTNDFPPDTTLNIFIREHAGLFGTKFMCLEGGCGVCICVAKGKHPATGEIRTWALNSCLTLLNACNGLKIITIEGIGNKKTGYHPIQKRLAELNGTQCGYCSPAMVMNMYGLLESKNGKVQLEEVENSFGGNLCRCTGYRPILDAMKSFASDSEFVAFDIVGNCDIEELNNKICSKTNKQCLAKCKFSSELSVTLNKDDRQWFRPTSIEELFKIFSKINNESYILIGGNTAHGVYRRSDHIKFFIDLSEIIELHAHQVSDHEIKLGGNINLTEAMEIFENNSKKKGFEYLSTLRRHFDLIANVPVRNTGTLAGNLMIKNSHKEFPSDVFITFEALQAKIEVMENEKTKIVLSPSEFINFDMHKKVISCFILPEYPSSEFIFDSYKIMPRAQNAHAYVNSSFLFQLDDEKKIKMAKICFGGITPDFVHANELELFLIGKQMFENATLKSVFEILTKILKPDWVLPDSSPEYRQLLASGLLFKSFISNSPESKVPDNFKSGGTILKREISNGTQTFETIEKNYPLTKPILKLEALIQTAGEALFMNDIPKQPDEVWCAFVPAVEVNSKIVAINPDKALAMPGVVAFYSAKDVPGKNNFMPDKWPFLKTVVEEVFCSDIVKYYNQPVGIIVAEKADQAEKAATKVEIMYEKTNKTILATLQDVLKEKPKNRIFQQLSLGKKLEKIPDVCGAKKIEGFLDVGSQYHFTMEPQTVVCLPSDQSIQVYCSNQWIDLQMIAISNFLNVPQNYIDMQVRRVGGGYGAKISRVTQLACACAMACHILNRPVRFVQPLESMMGCLGKRIACHSDYEAQFKENGKIVNYKNHFYEDLGCTLNESPIDYGVVKILKNCYEDTDNWDIDGKAVITDEPSHTSCRAPGALEAIAMTETVMEHIAFETKLDPIDVRLANIANDHKIVNLLNNFEQTSQYRERQKSIEKFNSNNRWKKKGLGVALMEYPIEYFGGYPALVTIYFGDGTVSVSHGGVEMGQGINTRVAQAVAYTLGIPVEKIRILPTDGFIGANAMATGGGVGSESAAYAARKACKLLNDRLAPIKKSMPETTAWEDLIKAAYFKGVNLSAQSFITIGDLKPYKVWGVASSECEVDILTGNHILKRVDILEDTGESLNPLLDVGQVEGAFVMGLGYWLTEQLVTDRQTGELLTTRTWNYKVPGVKDIPVDFRVNLLQNSPNAAGFLRSKTAAEPPICLSISAMFAIRHACNSAREDAGLERKWIPFGAPTTPENIVLNCGSSFDMFNF